MSVIKRFLPRALVVGGLVTTSTLAGIAAEALRPPAVPLVACDPYFSIWSPADKLTDADTVHWTGKPQRLTSLVRIDGKAFRVMGTDPADVPALPQTGLEVTPTRTIYTFEGEGVQLTLTFMTPALPEDLMIYSRPVTYVTWTVQATDGKKHEVGVYFDASGEIAVNQPTQPIMWDDARIGDLSVMKLGSEEQATLAKKGDDLRIDWGNLVVTVRVPRQGEVGAGAILSPAGSRNIFTEGWKISPVPPEQVPKLDYRTLPAAAPPWIHGASMVADHAIPKTATELVASFVFNSRRVGEAPVSSWLLLAYDDEYSIQYFKHNLRPYWRRNGDDAAALLKKAAADYESLKQRCERFDAEFMADMRQAGGEKYARLCALAYRQVVAGTKLVADANGQPLLFPKENTSNGCIGTVDVIYPMAPLFLLFNPSLAKAMLVPPLDYAGSPRWKFPFAPHDLGTYPLANGQVYGGGERTADDQMPVEESANLILLVTALAEREGNADFAAHYWPVLTQWAAYLKEKGFDPERQLCTDDFAGHLARNVNLSAKAIVALGAFGKLCEMRGENGPAREFTGLAKQFAARWAKEADDSDHFRLAFDQPGTWSQKYNLIWDRVLRLKLFPEAVLRKEMAYYPKVMKRYGLPLDNRKAWAELPWSFWTAALTGDDADFHRVSDPIYDYVNATPSRVPFPDFYWTDTAKEAGMHARPVLGGLFIKPLLDAALWQKWAGRDVTHSARWAPLPTPPKLVTILPAADTQPAVWRYTTSPPAGDWFQPAFNDASWSQGKSGFGTAGTPGAIIGTVWNTDDIWLRREIELPAGPPHDPQFWLHHDEDAEIYVNGVLALKVPGYISSYDSVPMTPTGRAALRPGKALLAVHCHQTTGGQYIDVGLVDVVPP